MNDNTQTLAQVKQEILGKMDETRVHLEEKIDAVGRKVDAVDRKVDAVDHKLTNLVTATTTALEHRIDKKLEQMEGRLLKAIDAALERGAHMIYEVARYDAAVLEDRMKALEHTLNEHISNERIHLPPDGARR